MAAAAVSDSRHGTKVYGERSESSWPPSDQLYPAISLPRPPGGVLFFDPAFEVEGSKWLYPTQLFRNSKPQLQQLA
jgi:hypothetical protein